MTSTLPLILNQEPVTRGMLTRMKVSTPSIAVVYADAFGHVASFDGRPLNWAQQVVTKYRTRFEVDLSDHRRRAQLDSTPLPSTAADLPPTKLTTEATSNIMCKDGHTVPVEARSR